MSDLRKPAHRIEEQIVTPAAWLACKCRNPRYTRINNTRQGYARKSILKPAGYLFLGV